jgi:hypothetical protein
MAHIPTIYCDEAGFTGNYLLDAAQTFFVFGSVDIEEHRARELISEVTSKFRLQNVKELKGQNLIKHMRGKAAIKWLMNECRQNFHLIYSDKVFAIAGKFFEIIFEPILAEHSTFFYRIDFHRFITNVIYYSLKRKSPLAVEAVDNIQSIFSKRDKPTGLIKSHKLNPQLLLDTIFYFCQLNEQVILSQMDYHADKSDSSNRWYLDLSVTSLHSSLVFWGQKYPEMKVLCDDSKPLSESRDIITLSGLVARGTLILNPDVPKFQVTEVAFGKSHEHPALQLADIFASSANYALNRRDAFWEDIVRQFHDNLSKYNLRPDMEYIDFNTEQAYRNGVILLRLIEESQKPGGFSVSPELLRGLALIQSVDLRTLEAAMTGEKTSNP